MKTFGVQEVWKRLGVGKHTILRWIKIGELKAINVARGTGGRPKWRITSEALAAFELARESSGPAPVQARRKAPAGPVLSFY